MSENNPRFCLSFGRKFPKHPLTTKFLTVCLAISGVVLPGFAQQATPVQSVNPFVGTGGHGHTFPGVTVPFGMVQVSPDSRLDGWDGCSGYHYSDSVIYGFSHTHLNGTGCIDYGDILISPTTGEPSLDNKEYSSSFSHQNEKASPGYYSVKLDKFDIQAELTSTARVGLHKYTFGKGGPANIVLDLLHRDKLLKGEIKVLDNKTITGCRFSECWAAKQEVFFRIEFSKPFTNSFIKTSDSNQAGAWFQFQMAPGEALFVKVALSAIDEEGAAKNMQAEMTGWNFDQVKNNAQTAWNKELGKIEVKGGTPEQTTIFYSALYHAMIQPNLYNDVDGRYRGRDLQIHKAEGFDYYTVFSLWDTFRAANPLYTIIDRKRTLDFIKTFLAQYDQGGRLPVWELSANETDCMIGYHSIPVIVDAATKGITDFDLQKALEAMKKSANWDHNGLPAYREQGFIGVENGDQSASKTLEYAYDDWCIAQFAKFVKNKDDYVTFTKRAQSYKNIFNAETGNIRPRISGDWLKPFNPKEIDGNFTEGNSWQYSFFVPQDINGHIALMGGKAAFENKVDELFTTDSKMTGREQSDVTGLIGQYAHGNEPSHHMAYLYNFVGKPAKTAAKVRWIMDNFYKNDPDGLIGNEDCGQMSSWFILSSMGFYSVTPASGQFVIGTPLFKEVVIHLENGRTFTIKAPEVSEKNIYINSARLNHAKYTKSFLRYDDIMKGGELAFEMTSTPDSQWGTRATDSPKAAITDHLIVPVPVIASTAGRLFPDKSEISMQSLSKPCKIYYTLDGSIPTSKSLLYTGPFAIDKSAVIKAIAVNSKGVASLAGTSTLRKVSDIDKRIDLTKGTVSVEHNKREDSPESEGFENLFDKKNDTKYLTKYSSGWVKFESANNVQYNLKGYCLTSANDAPDRDPKEWTLKGSNDGVNWTILDTQTNIDFSSRWQLRDFPVKTDQPYSQFKLEMTNHAGNMLQIAEIMLLGTPQK